MISLMSNWLKKKTRPSLRRCSSDLGKFWVIENDGLSKHIINNIAHEPHFFDFLKLISTTETNAFDLGANIGTHSVCMARQFSAGTVFAFEPLALTFSMLQMNILENNCLNVRSFRFAVTGETGRYVEMENTDFSKRGVNVGSSKIETSSTRFNDGVLTIKLDDFICPKISFIKMDIQGSEFNALIGMRRLVLRDRPLFFVEIEENYLVLFGASSKRLIEEFFALGYTLYRINTEYPCDHIAVPDEQVSDFETKLLPQYPWEVTKLKGQTIELTFIASRNTYDSFTLT